MTDPPNSESSRTLVAANGEPATTLSLATVRDQLRPALLSVLSLTFLTGALFPLILFVLARPMFPTQAKGSLVTRDGVIIGSELIGQNFTSAGVLPSATLGRGSGIRRGLFKRHQSRPGQP